MPEITEMEENSKKREINSRQLKKSNDKFNLKNFYSSKERME